MKKLNELHTKRLMVNFESDEVKQEREIDLKTQEITGLFHSAESGLKQFSKQGDEKKISESESKVRIGIQRSIAKRLQTLSQTFRNTQREYMAKLKGQKSGSGNEAFDFLDKKPINQATGEFIDRGFNQQQLAMLDDSEQVHHIYYV